MPLQPGQSRRGGFTLIEITVVVIVIALVSSLAIVRLDGVLPSTRTESAAREILATLDFARLQAIAKAQPYEVVLDFREQQYGIRLPFDREGVVIPNVEDRPMLSWNKMQDGVVLKSVLDARGDLLEEGQYSIVFDPQGAARQVYLYLGNENNENFELTIRVLALTGIASVIQGHVEPELLLENDF